MVQIYLNLKFLKFLYLCLLQSINNSHLNIGWSQYLFNLLKKNPSKNARHWRFWGFQERSPTASV